MITKDELASMIAALESQPHLSLKEEKYLAVCKELHSTKPCPHKWNILGLVGVRGGYLCCILCGETRVPE